MPDIFTILKLMLKNVLLFGGVLIVTAGLLLSSCGDPDYKGEKSPEDIKVIKADQQ
jgi:hypothetical protein